MDPSPPGRRTRRSFDMTHADGELRLAGDILDEPNFRAVADCTYDWESWHAPDGRLLWVNPAVERMTGYTVDECLSMAGYPYPMVVPSDHARLDEVYASARKEQSGNDVEFQMLHRDGTVRHTALSWQPMYDREGRHLGFRTSVRDITERHKLREELRLYAEHLEQLVQERTARIQKLQRHRREIEKLAALGQLAAGVAHEINNPLAGIRNAFELIKADVEPSHPHYELLELIDREIERISGIVHQMYQLYRRHPQRPTEFELERAVAEVVFLLQGVARKSSVTLEPLPRESHTTVLLPEGEVKQVLYNLLRNAIQASPPGETVEVEITTEGDEVQVRVRDHGVGIASEDIPRIFEPFFSTKLEDSRIGMGLGLSVSRSLVEAMGGRIEVTSRVGVGSLFVVTLPRRMEKSLPHE